MATRSTRDEKWERLESAVEEKLKQARKKAVLAESFDELEEIVEEIGHGGMADVYRTVQPSIGREVAVKVLPAMINPHLSFAPRPKVDPLP